MRGRCHKDQWLLRETTQQHRIRWDFNPPCAPYFGVFEAMIKSMKRALKGILGNTDISDEELHTAICGAESTQFATDHQLECSHWVIQASSKIIEVACQCERIFCSVDYLASKLGIWSFTLEKSSQDSENLSDLST